MVFLDGCASSIGGSVEVDVLHAQAGEEAVDAGQDGLVREEPATVLARDTACDLGGPDELVTGEEPGGAGDRWPPPTRPQ